MRCRECFFFQHYIPTNEYDRSRNFCGLHGCTTVDPDGEQRDLDHSGGCGYVPNIVRQLTVFDYGL